MEKKNKIKQYQLKVLDQEQIFNEGLLDIFESCLDKSKTCESNPFLLNIAPNYLIVSKGSIIIKLCQFSIYFKPLIIEYIF